MDEFVQIKQVINRCIRLFESWFEIIGMTHLYRRLVCLLGLVLVIACTQDQVLPREKCEDKVTYEEIKFLLNRKCGSSGCHDGTSGYGDYRSYNGMVTDISNGNIEAEVIQKGTMPQEDTLSTMEFHLIQCWIDNGYIQE